MNETETFNRLRSAFVVAVLIIDRAEDALPVAEALLAGGVTAMELTLRTPVALDAVRAVKRGAASMQVGVGTILKPEQVAQVMDAGGDFGVAPGTNPRVIHAALEAGLPFAPGVMTPTDIEMALEFERTFLKFFPSEPSGGLDYLRVVAAPFAHLGVQFIPLGGVTMANLPNYCAEPCVGAVGGSWLAPRNLIQARDWGAITAAARNAVEVRDRVRKGN